MLTCAWIACACRALGLQKLVAALDTPDEVLPTRHVIAPGSKSSERYPDIRFYDSMKAVKNLPDGVYRYGGSTSFAPLRARVGRDPVARGFGVNDAIERAHPRYRLRYVEPSAIPTGTAAGTALLLADKLDIAQSSQPLKDSEYVQARERGAVLQEVPVAVDGIAFCTHPGLRLPGLSTEQVRALLVGELGNWQQVGGPDLAVTPVLRSPDPSGTVEFVKEVVLPGKAPSRRTLYVANTTRSLRKVAATPGAIGFATSTEVCNQQRVRELPFSVGAQATRISPCSSRESSRLIKTRSAPAPTRSPDCSTLSSAAIGHAAVLPGSLTPICS